ncbi:MAG: 2-C-methyl-D-erythritol 2,4-cyclodiphosphate synthase [Phycisphaerales bacterium]|nr:2-C-methyl-D-erythritol 2,4-cyclodiphosphate synthase [Phycisphaerales bacterium]
MMYRTGIGYDVHRVADGRALVLGGVAIAWERGLLGHSDADVVLHALCDALLGASGLGDIGELFPDTDEANRGAASRVFVEEVMRRVRGRGFVVVNADLTIMAERPRLSGSKAAIRASVAGLLGVGPEDVGVKAGTNEGLDAVGRGEAIACLATVLLRKLA